MKLKKEEGARKKLIVQWATKEQIQKEHEEQEKSKIKHSAIVESHLEE